MTRSGDHAAALLGKRRYHPHGPHRLSADGSWWWGAPAADEGFRLWSTGLAPSMRLVERMTDDEVAAWTATLHPMAPEVEPRPRPASMTAKEAEVRAAATALTVNGYERLLELVRPEDRREALACLLGVVRAVASDLAGEVGGPK